MFSLGDWQAAAEAGSGPGQQTRMVVMAAFNALGRLAPGVSAEQAGVEARTPLQSSAGAMFGLPAGGTRRSVRGLDVDARVVPLLDHAGGARVPGFGVSSVRGYHRGRGMPALGKDHDMSQMLVSLVAMLLLAPGPDRVFRAQVVDGASAGGSVPFDAEVSANRDSGDTNLGSDHRVLATVRVSTMERELNEAAAEGFHLQLVQVDMSHAAGNVAEMVALVVRDARPGRFSYRLMTLSDVTAMEEEHARALARSAAEGFRYRGLVPSPRGGEAVVFLEHDADTGTAPVDYLVLATNRTSTLERELREAGARGYEVIALTMDAAGGDFSFQNARVALLSRPANAPSTPAAR